MYFLGNPRRASAGNRSLWLSSYGMELGVIFGVFLCIFAGWLIKSAAISAGDVVAILMAIGGIVGAWLAWSQRIYQQKSISRGSGQATGDESDEKDNAK